LVIGIRILASVLTLILVSVIIGIIIGALAENKLTKNERDPYE
jgi:hypothetical protein